MKQVIDDWYAWKTPAGCYLTKEDFYELYARAREFSNHGRLRIERCNYVLDAVIWCTACRRSGVGGQRYVCDLREDSTQKLYRGIPLCEDCYHIFTHHLKDMTYENLDRAYAMYMDKHKEKGD